MSALEGIDLFDISTWPSAGDLGAWPRVCDQHVWLVEMRRIAVKRRWREMCDEDLVGPGEMPIDGFAYDCPSILFEDVEIGWAMHAIFLADSGGLEGLDKARRALRFRLKKAPDWLRSKVVAHIERAELCGAVIAQAERNEIDGEVAAGSAAERGRL